jgi:hypothetical protein
VGQVELVALGLEGVGGDVAAGVGGDGPVAAQAVGQAAELVAGVVAEGQGGGAELVGAQVVERVVGVAGQAPLVRRLDLLEAVQAALPYGEVRVGDRVGRAPLRLSVAGALGASSRESTLALASKG